ncbi:MAG: serine--tRNA ligase [Candidatus Saccharimonadales bacterium]|nr:serine--tRNA ligase [Candidatus Saccharimonadales bacterium]
MLDIEFIRDNREAVKNAAKNKQINVDVDKLLELDEQRRDLIEKTEKIRQERNQHAEKLKAGKPSDEDVAKGKKLKDNLAELESKLEPVVESFHDLLKQVPNIATEDTPVGATENENQTVYEWGTKPDFEFKPRNHWEIAEARGWIDKERAAKVAGARFAYIKGPLVKLQLAIMQFTINTLTDEQTLKEILKEAKLELPSKSFTAVLPPYMIREDVFDAMDRLEPREDRYKIEGEDLWLQGSAEHVMGSMYMDEIIDEKDLPIRFIGYASSFRREAGNYGKDMEGIIRLHQFDKLEMETLSTPETGLDEHMLTIAIQEHLMRQLELPYRKLLKCTADIGKPNARGVDLDAWLPGQGQYKETHTADFMTDYQTRRLKTRVRREDGSIDYAHTIDATAFAVGRAMVAIIENNQTEDMKVVIPAVLRPLMGGTHVI